MFVENVAVRKFNFVVIASENVSCQPVRCSMFRWLLHFHSNDQSRFWRKNRRSRNDFGEQWSS